MSGLSVGTPEISNDDLYAIDVYYGFDVHNGYSLRESFDWRRGVFFGGNPLPTGPKVDQDRMAFMDEKDLRDRERKGIEDFPLKMGVIGFGAAAVLFTPGGAAVALGVGAVWGCNKLYKEWSE